MNLQESTFARPATQQAQPKAKNKKYITTIIILAVLTIGGFIFGGIGFWHKTQKDDNVASETILSVDRDSELGKGLYEKIQNIEVTDMCGSVYHPLYEGGDVINLSSISRGYIFGIIAMKISKIANLKEDGERVEVSEDEVQEVFDSIFSDYRDIDYDVFNFYDSSPDDNIQRIGLYNYEIIKTEDKKYIIERKEEPEIACVQARFQDFYEYVGLSNTIDDQIMDNKDYDGKKAMIVLEKKTIDNMKMTGESESNGYYGVLFNQSQDSNDYLWIGTYYLGNIINKQRINSELNT